MVNITAPNEVRKQCPECKASLKPDAALCRFCGYTYASATDARAGAPAAVMPLGVQPASSLRETLRLARPLLIGFAALIVVIAVFWPSNRPARAANQADRDMERWISESLQRLMGPIYWQVKANDGVCQIRIATGFPAQQALDLTGRSATRYSKYRRDYGEGRRATVILYASGRKLAVAEADDGVLTHATTFGAPGL